MDKATEEKLHMWQKKLAKLKADYEIIMQKRGEAMAMGDISENAAFQMLDEDASTYRVRIDEVRKIIADTEKAKK